MSNFVRFASILFQQPEDDQLMGVVASACISIFILVMVVIILAGFWKTFTKAGYPGWAAIIPIYNIYIILKIAGRPGWWLLLMLVPLVNIIIWLIVCIDVAKSFGKDVLLWGIILLWLLNGLGFLLLGFDDSEYQGPAAAA